LHTTSCGHNCLLGIVLISVSEMQDIVSNIGVQNIFKKYARTMSENELNKVIQSTFSNVDDRVAAYLFRAGVHVEQKYYQQALDDLDRALVLKPNDTKLRLTVLNNKGYILFDKKEFQQSLGEFNAALEVLSTFHLSLKGRGLTHLAMGNIELALKDLDAAISIYPDDSKYAARAGVKLRKGQHMGALSDANESLRLNPANHTALCYKALAFCHQGSFAHALHGLSKSIEIQPISFYYGFRSIVWYILQGNRTLAEDDFVHADKAAGTFDEMLNYFKEVIAQSPSDVHTRLMRGVLYNLLGNKEGMKLDFATILSSNNETLRVICTNISDTNVLK